MPDPTRRELRIERVVAGGDGLARPADGAVVLVEGALPGEAVEVEIVRSGRDVHWARVIEVLEPSPARVAPPCPFVARRCGGCSWQHVDPAAQAPLKRDIVIDALRRIARIPEPDVELGPVLDPFGFRTTLRVAVQGGRIGLRARHAHDVVSIGPCLVAHPLLDDLMARVTASGRGELLLRCGARTGERMVRAFGGASIRSRPEGTTTGPIHEIIGGHRFRISPGSFFQARPDGADVLAALTARAVPADARVVIDAYAGVGLLSAAVAAAVPRAQLVAIEQNRTATSDARHNLAGWDVDVVTGEVGAWRPEPADVVVADPARPGLGRTAAATLAATGAGVVVLVSCDPASLARDAALLAAHGYHLDRSTVVDMFPHTPHVEVVSRFSRPASSEPGAGAEHRA